MVRRREYLFVDGYNIINSWEEFKSIKEISLEEARERLIDILIEYQATSGMNIILVFDGHLVKEQFREEIDISGLKVIYTKSNETADHYIEASVNQIDKRDIVRVATSDWMEQQIVLGKGASRISARELEEEVLGRKSRLRRNYKQENMKNNLILSGLDEKNIQALKKIMNKNKSVKEFDKKKKD